MNSRDARRIGVTFRAAEIYGDIKGNREIILFGFY